MIIAQGQFDYKGGLYYPSPLAVVKEWFIIWTDGPKVRKVRESAGHQRQSRSPFPQTRQPYFLYMSLYVTTRFQRREFSDVVHVCAAEQTEGSAKFLTSQVFQSSTFCPKQSGAFLLLICKQSRMWYSDSIVCFFPLKGRLHSMLYTWGWTAEEMWVKNRTVCRLQTVFHLFKLAFSRMQNGALKPFQAVWQKVNRVCISLLEIRSTHGQDGGQSCNSDLME